ncbi:MAG: hypothetical protein QG611_1107, partial [Bacteroidota bacterium]|nr:hypothetical protein [Bacteroidota bacterium]
MKTRILFFLTAVLLIINPVNSNAQVGGLLKNKINRVINAGTRTVDKEINKEIDSAVEKEVLEARDKQIQEAKNQSEKDSTDQGAQKSTGQTKQGGKSFNLGGLMGGKVTSKYNESYAFNNRIYMQMEMYDKKDVTKMDYYIYFSDATPTAGFESKMIAKSEEGEEVTVTSSYVFDGENKSFIIMTDMGTMKMGIISEVPDETATQGQPAEKTPKATITKTGNSKVIAGYKCDEYLYKDNESKDYGKLWVTKDLKLKADKRTYSKAGLPAYYGNPEIEDGSVLAMESYNEKGVLEMKSETKEINLNFPHTISVAGYTFRQMN